MRAPALDPAALMPWLDAAGVQLDATSPVRLLAGGRSNRTLQLRTKDGGSVALRMAAPDAPAGAQRTMLREWRFISGLSETPVPVPGAIGFCDDLSILGVPFYVMAFVDGLTIDDIQSASTLAPDTRYRLGENLIRILAELHALNPAELGLEDVGKGHGFLQRQLQLWSRIWREWPGSAGFPEVDALHRELCGQLGLETAITLVHGDYKLGNAIADDRGSVLAVLDWELGTLGDPLSDLGWVLSQWPEPGEEGTGENGDASPTLAGGFPTRDDLIESYARVSGRDVSDAALFEAMGHWKSICEIAGVAHRAELSGGEAEGSHDLVPTIGARARRAAQLLGCSRV